MRRWRLMGLGAAATLVLTSASVLATGSPASAKDGTAMRLAKGELRASSIQAGSVTRQAPVISDSTAVSAQDVRSEESDAAGGVEGPSGVTGGAAPGSLGCSGRDSSGNVRVNQDCTFRRQAEEVITFNSANPNNLLAGQNDSRVGYNQCGIDYSTDNGKHWGDMIPPFRQHTNNPALQATPTSRDPNRHTILGGPGTGHTYDAGSDPTVAFDSRGNGYFSCVAFDINSNASLLYVTQSPAFAQGAYFHNVPDNSKRYIVAEDNSPLIFHDKNFITADANPASPNRDNVYVTWTVFKFDPSCGVGPNPDGVARFCSSPIFGSMSTDHAHTWSTPEEISGTSDALCSFGNFFDPSASPHACNFDQGSDPRTLPNGDLEVVFNNTNTAAGNPNGQQLGVHCSPTGSSPAGTAHLNCVAPSKVGDDVSSGEPQCDFGRGPEECVPGPYIRTNDFPRIANAPDNSNNHLYTTWQDYRNGEYDVQLSQSLDGGLTWHEVGTVNPDRGLDHYFPAVAQAFKTDRVGDSYFRSDRVPGENQTPSGGFAPGQNAGVGASNSDYVLSGGVGAATPYNFKVLSPVFGPPDGIQTGFNGDYSGLTINKGEDAHPIWSDTRNLNPDPENGVTHDEDVFTDNVGLPNGNAAQSTGRLGSG